MDAVRYQEWLAVQRKSAKNWEALPEGLLSIKPGNEGTADSQGFVRERFSSSLAPLNNKWIGWIYTVDLDRETLSVNKGAHFKLEQVPYIGWTISLADGGRGDKIALPDAVPLEALTHLVVEQSPQSSELSRTLGDLTISDVGFSFRYQM